MPIGSNRRRTTCPSKSSSERTIRIRCYSAVELTELLWSAGFDDGRVFKVKNRRYRRLHSVKEHRSIRGLWRLLLAGELDLLRSMITSEFRGKHQAEVRQRLRYWSGDGRRKSGKHPPPLSAGVHESRRLRVPACLTAACSWNGIASV